MLVPLTLTFFILLQLSAAVNYDVSFARLAENPAIEGSYSVYLYTAIFNNGDVLVGGNTKGLVGYATIGGGTDFLLRRYSDTGTLLWTKVFGGPGLDTIEAVALDSSENIYATGSSSTTENGYRDVYFAKFDSSGNEIYSTIFGGTGHDEGLGIRVDSARGVFYIAGNTRSPTFYDAANFGPFDAFLLKVNSATGAIINSVRSGVASYATEFVAITLNSIGDVWVAGRSNAPTYVGQPGQGGNDIIVQKFSSEGISQAVHRMGGSGNDFATGMATDSSGNVYVAGWASSSIEGQTAYGGVDIFVTKFNSAGTKLWTKLFGSAGTDSALDMTVDSAQGLIYVTGYLYTANFYDASLSSTNYYAYLLVINSNTGSYVTSKVYGMGSSGIHLSVHGSWLYMSGDVAGTTFEGQSISGFGTAGFLMRLSTSSASPSTTPSASPSTAPSASPSTAPSASPSTAPSASPSTAPSAAPSATPSTAPSASPSTAPSASPSTAPSASPSTAPSASPSTAPSTAPTASPSVAPSAAPSAPPSAAPSASPSAVPSASPSTAPSASPSTAPSASPSTAPSASPSTAPSAAPSATPSAVPTDVPTTIPTVAPTRTCIQWTLGDYGESCSATCRKLSRTCKDKYLKNIVTQEAFYAVVGSAVNVRSNGAVGSAETFCSQTTDSVVKVGGPSALSIVLSSEDHHSPVRTSCTYPTSTAEATLACDAVVPLHNYRRFCPCVDHNCDGAWYLGYSGDSCDATCTSAGGVCDAEPLNTIVDADAFSAMVTSATVVETNEVIGESSASFCHEGINILPLAPAPSVITLTFGAVNETLCAYPTSVANLQGSCDVAFTDLPARRFCNCKVMGPPSFHHRTLLAAGTSESTPAQQSKAALPTPRLRGQVTARIEV